MLPRVLLIFSTTVEQMTPTGQHLQLEILSPHKSLFKILIWIKSSYSSPLSLTPSRSHLESVPYPCLAGHDSAVTSQWSYSAALPLTRAVWLSVRATLKPPKLINSTDNKPPCSGKAARSAKMCTYLHNTKREYSDVKLQYQQKVRYKIKRFNLKSWHKIINTTWYKMYDWVERYEPSWNYFDDDFIYFGRCSNLVINSWMTSVDRNTRIMCPRSWMTSMLSYLVNIRLVHNNNKLTNITLWLCCDVLPPIKIVKCFHFFRLKILS